MTGWPSSAGHLRRFGRSTGSGCGNARSLRVLLPSGAPVADDHLFLVRPVSSSTRLHARRQASTRKTWASTCSISSRPGSPRGARWSFSSSSIPSGFVTIDLPAGSARATPSSSAPRSSSGSERAHTQRTTLRSPTPPGVPQRLRRGRPRAGRACAPAEAPRRHEQRYACPRPRLSGDVPPGPATRLAHGVRRRHRRPMFVLQFVLLGLAILCPGRAYWRSRCSTCSASHHPGDSAPPLDRMANVAFRPMIDLASARSSRLPSPRTSRHGCRVSPRLRRVLSRGAAVLAAISPCARAGTFPSSASPDGITTRSSPAGSSSHDAGAAAMSSRTPASRSRGSPSTTAISTMASARS